MSKTQPLQVRHRKRPSQAEHRTTRPIPAHFRVLERRKAGRRRHRISAREPVFALREARRRPLGENETVLVVDAEPMNRAVLVRSLRRLGCRVLEAAGAMEAHRLAAPGKRIDLLLAEFSALGPSGVGLVRWFCANRRDSAALVAADWLWEAESCLGDLPRFGILAKPFTPTELARMVSALLRRLPLPAGPKR